MIKKGCFISFEGGDGSGKTTQAKLLISALKKSGIDAIHTREPGGEQGAEEIRQLLVKGGGNRWEPITETLLFLAARVQHFKRIIEPALKAGTWVVSDRFHDSTIVYQGIQGISTRYYNLLHSATLGNIQPDITFLLDIDITLGLERSLSRNNSETRFEKMDRKFHELVRQCFLDLADKESNRFFVIDANQNEQDVHLQIYDKIYNRFRIAFSQ